MSSSFIYLDNHATTAVDPRVAEVVARYLTQEYGNAGSVTHALGLAARDVVESARANIAAQINAEPSEVIFTSGATESDNLALRGLALHPRTRGRHIISVATEHAAVLDPLRRLQREGFAVSYLPVQPNGCAQAGRIDVQQLIDAITPQTFLVSIMLANNEIGVLQPLRLVGQICQDHGIVLHSDVTQALGRVPIDVHELQVSLMSFSAHKIYGPKGVGALYVRGNSPRVRLSPLMNGGGQERGLRSGTLNVPGIMGLAKAVELCALGQPSESDRTAALRNQLWERLCTFTGDVILNGPALARRDYRLAENLNLQFTGIQAEALMVALRDRLALSSGSTCSAAQPQPSHVLSSLGLPPDKIFSSLRIGLGRFTTEREIEEAAELLAAHVHQLRALH